MEFNIIIDKNVENNKAYITINKLTNNKEIANREVIECAYIETENDDYVVDLAVQELAQIMKKGV